MKKGWVGLISFVFGAISGAIASETTIGRGRKREVKDLMEDNNKFYEFYEILVQWLKVRQDGKFLSDFFHEQGYKSIAIYGMKELGVRFLEELNDSDIEVKYAVDRDADLIYVPIEVLKPNDKLPKVDAMVVTAIHYFDDIECQMRNVVDCPIISLEDVVFEA